MRFSTIMIGVSVLLFSIPLSSMGSGVIDGVGLYFDQEATVNCLPDSTNFPFSLDAYLILENPSAASGISGWEGRLEFDAGLFGNLVSISGDAINTSTFPEFRVGLGTPLPADSLVILAVINVVALNAGGIGFEAHSEPSSRGLDYPLYLPAAEPNDYVQMAYSYGGYGDPVASIGNLDCPVDRSPGNFSNQPVLVCDVGISEWQYRPEIVTDHFGNSIIIWEDYRYQAYGLKDIYAQRLDYDGNALPHFRYW